MEIAIKISSGKFNIEVSYEDFLRSGIEDRGFEILPIEVRHTNRFLTMPFHQKVPFDRLRVAQSLAEKIPLVSCDVSLDAYSIVRIW